MKIIATSLALATLFFSAFASAASPDVSGAVHISGVVKSSQEGNCSIILSTPELALHGTQLENLSFMTDRVEHTSTDTVGITLAGDACNKNNVGLKFIGETVSGNDNALRNSLGDNTAAQGVGVGLYYFGELITPNSTVVHYINDSALGGYMPVSIKLFKMKNMQPTAGKYQTSVMVQLERL